MQMTLEIPDTLAAQLAATGKEPARAALEALEEWAIREEALEMDPEEEAEVREAIRQGLADVAAGRVRPAREVFEEMRHKYAIPR